MRYHLGPFTFKNKKQIKSRCDTILAAGYVGGDDFLFLSALFQWHHNIAAKTDGHPIQDIKVDWFGRERIFWLRARGDWVHISAKKAIRRSDQSSARRAKFIHRLRTLVYPQVAKFRDGRPGGHVDHCGDREFRHLVDDFVRERRIGLDHPTAEVCQQWIEFHQAHAELRLVPAGKNLTKKRKRADLRNVYASANLLKYGRS